MTRTMACERCGDPCEAPEDEFEEVLCEDCEQNIAERGQQMLNDAFFGGSNPFTAFEKHAVAFREKIAARGRK